MPFTRLFPAVLLGGRSPLEPGARPDPLAILDAVNPLTWRRAGNALATWRPDFVLAAHWTMPVAPSIGVAARRSGAPVVGLVHNVVPHEPIPGARATARWMLRRCGAVVALSDAVSRGIRDVGYAGPVFVTPHPAVDHFPDAPERGAARRALDVADDRPLVLFFGLVRAYKGLDHLVEALALLSASKPDATLVVAGEWYQDKAPILRRIEALGLRGRVRIEDGYVPDHRVPVLFGAADVVALPYTSGTQSGVVMTAARFGTPAVVSDVGGISAQVIEYGSGIVVPPADPESLARALDEALDPSRNAALREGAVRLSGERSWSRFARTVLQAAETL